MEKIFEIVQASAALEGSTLNQAECERLLAEGISSEGKTIAEQLLCLNLRSAYEKCFRMAVDHEFWSVYRLKSLAAIALRDSGIPGEIVSDERVLQKICDIANGMRLHIGGDDAMDQYKASFMIHYLVSTYKPWEGGNDYIGRLLNGTVFDTSIRDTAMFYGIYSSGRSYGPVSINFGSEWSDSKMGAESNSIISGFARTLWTMHPKEKGTGIFYSPLGYSYNGSGGIIPPYSPLRFDIELVANPN